MSQPQRDNNERPLDELQDDPDFQWRITKVDGDVAVVLGEAWTASMSDIPMPVIMHTVGKAMRNIADMVAEQALVNAYEEEDF